MVVFDCLQDELCGEADCQSSDLWVSSMPCLESACLRDEHRQDCALYAWQTMLQLLQRKQD